MAVAARRVSSGAWMSSRWSGRSANCWRRSATSSSPAAAASPSTPPRDPPGRSPAATVPGAAPSTASWPPWTAVPWPQATTGRSPTCAGRSSGWTSSNRRRAPVRSRVGSPARTHGSPGRARRSTGGYGEAAATAHVGGERLDRLTIMARLSTEPDPAARRTLFEALAPIWQVVDGDGDDASPYRKLLRSSAKRWDRHGSPVEAAADAIGLPSGSLEETLRSILVAWRTVLGPGRLEPWDYWFAVGAAARRLDRLVTQDGLLDLNHRYLAALGADPTRLGIRYDVMPRPGRPAIPVAFTIGMGITASQRADGRAVDPASALGLRHVRGGRDRKPPRAAPRERACASQRGRSGRDRHSSTGPLPTPGSSRGRRTCWVGTPRSRRGNGRGWATPLRRGRRCSIDTAPSCSTSAGRCSRSNSTGTPAGARMTSGRRSRPTVSGSSRTPSGRGGRSVASSSTCPATWRTTPCRRSWPPPSGSGSSTLRGPWFDGDPGWYAFMSDALFEAGASRPPADLLESLLGGPLTAEPLLADLRGVRPGSAPVRRPRPPGTAG